jgi:hypothetical protein
VLYSFAASSCRVGDDQGGEAVDIHDGSALGTTAVAPVQRFRFEDRLTGAGLQSNVPARSAVEHLRHNRVVRCQRIISVVEEGEPVSCQQQGDRLLMLPQDTSLPFFAYGIFKPGQLAFARLADCIGRVHERATTRGTLARDGLPILAPGRWSIQGTVFTFQESRNHTAYQRIAELEPDSQYRWDIVKVSSAAFAGAANTLVGRSPERGSIELDETDWDGGNDPLFTTALTAVEEVFQENLSIRMGPQTSLSARNGLLAPVVGYRAFCNIPLPSG